MANGYQLTLVQISNGVETATLICASVNQNKINSAQATLNGIIGTDWRDDPTGTGQEIVAFVLQETGVTIQLTIDVTADAIVPRIAALPII